MSNQAPDPGTPIKQCTVAELYEWEDGCQAQTWIRCSICGAHEGGTCNLSAETVAYRYLNATQQQEDRVRKVNEALAFGRWYAQEMVKAERLKQGLVTVTPPEPTPAWLLLWRGLSSVIAIIVLSVWVISLFE